MDGFLKQYFYRKEKTLDAVFERVAFIKANKESGISERIYSYLKKGWFLPSTPILANLGTTRGLPISCFLNEVDDNMQSIIDIGISEVCNLMALGGGVATNWSNIREIGAAISTGGKTSGVIPFIKNQEILAMSISQGGSLRRGNVASYLNISHPEIQEFIAMRKANGGDVNRKILHGHHGVIIDDVFMARVAKKEKYHLISPLTGETVKTVNAFDLWTDILTARIETGEPYILFIDTVNENRCESYKRNDLMVSTSNLCSEIVLTTEDDYQDKKRTAVCCLSSLNLEHFQEFYKDKQFFEDVLTFLDNVLTEFIKKTKMLGKASYIENAIYSAMMERSVGLGVMGFHSHLQQKKIPFDSDEAMLWNQHIFSTIKNRVDEANIILGRRLGANPDCRKALLPHRFSNTMAIAPTASISVIANTSPSIDPITSNIIVQKNKTGTAIIKNKNLEKCLEVYGKNDDETWNSISEHLGSVAHLNFMNKTDKEIFKTAFEISMIRLVQMAAERQKYIDQTQSLNLFFLPNVEKKHFHEVHFLAWKLKVKSLYYVRSLNLGKLLAKKKVICEEDVCTVCQ